VVGQVENLKTGTQISLQGGNETGYRVPNRGADVEIPREQGEVSRLFLRTHF
jgi:hypothetical protein